MYLNQIITVKGLAFVLIMVCQTAFSGAIVHIDEVKASMDPEEHINKDYIPPWLSKSDQTSGFELSIKRKLLNLLSGPKANVLWLFGSSAYDEKAFSDARVNQMNALLPESGITPEMPVLFNVHELAKLNLDIPARSIRENYESAHNDQAATRQFLDSIHHQDQEKLNGIQFFHHHYANGNLEPEEVVDNFYLWLDSEAPWHIQDMLIKKNKALAIDQAKASAERWKICHEGYNGDFEQCRQAGIIRTLEGIPMVVKDEISVPGYTTSYGLDPFRVDKEFPVHTEESQSEVVKRMTNEGAIVLGKSNQHIFGLGAFGLNPHFPRIGNIFNSANIPGGSSSGSAMFVGIGGPLALGTDGGGSISIPAANNGVPGLKPTERKLTVQNYDNAAPGLVAIGLIGQSFADIAQGYMVTSNKWPTTQVTKVLQDLHIGIDAGWFQHASSDVANTTLTCLQTLVDTLTLDTGTSPNLVSMEYLPKGYEKPLWDTHATLFGRGEAKEKSDFIDKGIPAETELALIMGLALDQSTIDRAQKNKETLTEHFEKRIFSKVDIIAMPTVLTTAPKAERPWFQAFDNGEINLAKAYLMAAHTGLANLTGGPRITVQCGFDENNLPIGLQLMGSNHSEYLLMLLGATVEKSILKRDQEHPAWKLRPHFNPLKNN